MCHRPILTRPSPPFYPLAPGASRSSRRRTSTGAAASSPVRCSRLPYRRRWWVPAAHALPCSTTAPPRPVLFHVDIEAVFKALEKRGVVCDVRKPDVMRIAPTPLYNTFAEVYRCDDSGRPRLFFCLAAAGRRTRHAAHPPTRALPDSLTCWPTPLPRRGSESAAALAVPFFCYKRQQNST